MNRRDRAEQAKRLWDAIPDPTNNSLNAALLDQKVAGIFEGQDYAYVPVVNDNGYGIGIAVANEDGYNPVGGMSFNSYAEARLFADGMNKHIGLPMDHVTGIVCSTMGGYSYRPVAR